MWIVFPAGLRFSEGEGSDTPRWCYSSVFASLMRGCKHCLYYHLWRQSRLSVSLMKGLGTVRITYRKIQHCSHPLVWHHWDPLLPLSIQPVDEQREDTDLHGLVFEHSAYWNATSPVSRWPTLLLITEACIILTGRSVFLQGDCTILTGRRVHTKLLHTPQYWAVVRGGYFPPYLLQT